MQPPLPPKPLLILQIPLLIPLNNLNQILHLRVVHLLRVVRQVPHMQTNPIQAIDIFPDDVYVEVA